MGKDNDRDRVERGMAGVPELGQPSPPNLDIRHFWLPEVTALYHLPLGQRTFPQDRQFCDECFDPGKIKVVRQPLAAEIGNTFHSQTFLKNIPVITKRYPGSGIFDYFTAARGHYRPATVVAIPNVVTFAEVHLDVVLARLEGPDYKCCPLAVGPIFPCPSGMSVRRRRSLWRHRRGCWHRLLKLLLLRLLILLLLRLLRVILLAWVISLLLTLVPLLPLVASAQKQTRRHSDRDYLHAISLLINIFVLDDTNGIDDENFLRANIIYCGPKHPFVSTPGGHLFSGQSSGS